MIRFGVFFPSQLTTRQAIHDLRMPKEDLKTVSEVFDDTLQVEEGLGVWKTMTDDIINKITTPTRDLEKNFEASAKREWEAVKKELEKSLLGASSQDGLVSIRITSQPYLNHRFRASSPAGGSIDFMWIPISTGWHDLSPPFKHNMLTRFSKSYLRAFKNS